MDVAFVEIVAAGEAKNIFSENLFAEKIGATFDIRRDVPSAGENKHDDRTTDKTHAGKNVPALFDCDPNERDHAGKNQPDRALGQNGKRDRDV